MAITLLIAQTAAAAPGAMATIPTPHERLTKRYRNALVRRNLGWGLTAVGLAAIAAGSVVAVFGATQVNTNAPGGYDQAITDVIAGAATGICGLGLVIPGVILSLQGQGEMTEVEWRLRAASQIAFIAPGSTGFMVGARLAF